MASSGKHDVEVEVKSPPEKFWSSFRDAPTLFPKILPEQYKSIEILEGDGKSVGSIIFIKYAEGIPNVTFSKEKIETVDEGKKTISYSVIDGDLMAFYTSFKVSFQVTPKGDGSLVKVSVELEKAKEEVPDPKLVLQFVVKIFNDLDAYLLKA